MKKPSKEEKLTISELREEAKKWRDLEYIAEMDLDREREARSVLLDRIDDLIKDISYQGDFSMRLANAAPHTARGMAAVVSSTIWQRAADLLSSLRRMHLSDHPITQQPNETNIATGEGH